MKTWFITGASSGIGKATAEYVLKKGDCAAITARNASKLDDIVSRYPDTALALSLEVTDAESRKQAVKAAVEKFGRIDVLYNNAGRGFHAALEDTTSEDMHECFETNFFGPVGMIQEVLPYMRAQNYGVIMNTSSMGVHFLNSSGNAFYVAAKLALEEMSMTLQNEVEPFGIKVMVIEPGTFRTNFRVNNIESTGSKTEEYLQTAYVRDAYVKANLFNQKGNPEKAGAIIADIPYMDPMPKVLVLGGNMVETELKTLQNRADEIVKWKELSDSTDFEDGE